MYYNYIGFPHMGQAPTQHLKENWFKQINLSHWCLKNYCISTISVVLKVKNTTIWHKHNPKLIPFWQSYWRNSKKKKKTSLALSANSMLSLCTSLVQLLCAASSGNDLMPRPSFYIFAWTRFDVDHFASGWRSRPPNLDASLWWTAPSDT